MVMVTVVVGGAVGALVVVGGAVGVGVVVMVTVGGAVGGVVMVTVAVGGVLKMIIAITAYKRPQLLKRCLESIMAADLSDVQRDVVLCKAAPNKYEVVKHDLREAALPSWVKEEMEP